MFGGVFDTVASGMVTQAISFLGEIDTIIAVVFGIAAIGMLATVVRRFVD